MKNHALRWVLVLLACGSIACNDSGQAQDRIPHSLPDEGSDKLAKATFGSGCFWCTEAVYQQLHGVRSVTSGYAGGKTARTTYEEVCSGSSGHAEVVQVEYDPSQVGYEKLLEVFWKSHDPTTLNRQGNDVGTQYRSVVFYHDEDQKVAAEKYKKLLDESGAFDKPIVTEIVPLTNWSAAEDYHQDYFDNNRTKPYCQMMIAPKVAKIRKVFADALRDPR